MAINAGLSDYHYGACGKHAHLKVSVVINLHPVVLQVRIKAQYCPTLVSQGAGIQE